jgi:membrane associated rhomboid family serine protease
MTDMAAWPDNLQEIGRFADEEVAHDYGLVVLSAGAGYWVEENDEGTWSLVVESGYVERLRPQLELYEQESKNWPPVQPEMPEPHPGAYAAMTWIAVLILAWLCQLRWPALEKWGMVSSEAIRAGEVYRAFTALFLHNDIGHLSGNLLFGAVFLHLVARHIGTLRAWLGVLVAGTAGNLLNAALYFETTHYSIGASTAVFGTIGLLVCLPIGFALRHARQQLFRLWFLPLIAGLAFLAWFGTGTEQTDTTAHLMGFLCGLPIGIGAGLLMRE